MWVTVCHKIASLTLFLLLLLLSSSFFYFILTFFAHGKFRYALRVLGSSLWPHVVIVVIVCRIFTCKFIMEIGDTYLLLVLAAVCSSTSGVLLLVVLCGGGCLLLFRYGGALSEINRLRQRRAKFKYRVSFPGPCRAVGWSSVCLSGPLHSSNSSFPLLQSFIGAFSCCASTSWVELSCVPSRVESLC